MQTDVRIRPHACICARGWASSRVYQLNRQHSSFASDRIGWGPHSTRSANVATNARRCEEQQLIRQQELRDGSILYEFESCVDGVARKPGILKSIQACRVQSRDELAEMKVVDLKKLCRQNGVVGYSKLRKVELIAAIAPPADER